MNFSKQSNYRLVFLISAMVVLLIFLLSKHHPFFWDTLLTSSILQHFIENGLGNFILPENLDAGHPPFFYAYLFCVITLFGKSLFVAHLAMLPFLFLLCYAVLSLLDYFKFNTKEKLLTLLFTFSIPAVLTQSFLISYDIAILAIGLLCLNFALKKQFILFSIFSVVLCSVSVRGNFVLIGIVFISFLMNDRKYIVRTIISLIPSILFCAIWYGYHYAETGYFLQGNNGWQEQRNIADVQTIFKNIISIGRKLFDFGIVCLFVLNIISFLDKCIDRKLFLWIIPFVILSIIFVSFTNPIGHRYYLIVYVLMLLPIVKYLAKKPSYFSVILILLLFISNYQIYGARVSNGWDCTLAHLYYFNIKKDADNYLKEKNIQAENIGTVFPLTASSQQMYWIGDTDKMNNVNGENLDSTQYILYSNIANDFSDEQLDELKEWKIIWQKKSVVCNMILYENPTIENELQ